MKNGPIYVHGGIKKMKILLVMKLTTFFMLACCFAVSANSYSQKQLVSIELQKCTVNKLFKEIRKQTGLRFVYNEAHIAKFENFDLRVQDQTVESVLESVFEGTSYKCVFEDDVIFVVPRPKEVVADSTKQKVVVKPIVIKGKVTDPTGMGLPGVSIIVEGTTKGISTDINGHYEFSVQPRKDLTFVFSFIGMKSQKVVYKGQKVIDVLLEEDDKKLDDVVVIGYGQRKKGTITGSVVMVEAKKLETMPVPSLEQALQGQSAGVQVMSYSGEPGAGAKINIRGINSISAGTDPLYVMDGVVVSSGDFASINMADIENYTVLKDAASTSIYGSRAANGVILITTKRGKYDQNARVNFRTQQGWSSIAYGKNDVMNTKERLDYEEMIGFNIDNPDWNRADYENTDVDWMKAIYNDNAPTSSYDLSISGGSQTLSYYISAGYYAQEGIQPNSDFNRYTFKLNLEGKMKPWLKAGGSLTLGYEKNDYSMSGSNSVYTPSNAALLMLPYWNPYRADGSISSIGDHSFIGPANPLELYNSGFNKENYLKLVGSLFLELNPIKNLVIRSMLGMDGNDGRAIAKNKPSSVYNNGQGSVREGFSRRYSMTLTNTANYLFSIQDEHNFNLLVGQEAIASYSEVMTADAIGLFDDRLLTLSVARKPSAVGGGSSEYSYLSWFGRLSYDFRSKYFVDLSVRSDGSSRFGADNRWATFWSVGAMWNMKGEKFLENIGVLSNAQLSASIGTSGNSSIDGDAHLALIQAGAFYMNLPAWSPLSLGNEKLTWEKLRDINVGLKLGFWDRVSVGIEYYSKLTSNMLMSVPISMTSGYSSWMDNVGKMTNKGLDLQLDVTPVRISDFTWNVTANASYNKNKILELYGDVDSYVIGETGLLLQVGEDVGSLIGVRYAGVNPANGDALWYDKEGNLTNEFNKSNEVLLDGKSRNAPWSGAFTNNFMYKGFSLSVFFTWVKGRYMYNNTRFFTESNGNFVSNNQSKKMFNSWKKPGDITDVPRYGIYAEEDDRFIEDASFLRLKNVMLAYTFTPNFLKKTRVIEGLRIYGQAQNLLTFTKYTGFDPENPSQLSMGDYPQSKQFIFGLDVTF